MASVADRANGFESQADVVIEARRAGDVVGATKMDRPEDVEANPVTNKVYAMLTNNSRRTAQQMDPAKPAGGQPLRPYHGDDPTGRRPCRAEVPLGDLVRCGDPSVAAVGATFHKDTPRTAGSACRTIAPSTRWDACGSRPTATASRAPAATTASGPWRRKALRAARRSSSSASPMAPSSAGRNSRQTWRRSSSRCSTGRAGRRRSELHARELQQRLDALARLQGRRAAETLHRGDHEEGRRQDRRLILGDET